MDFSKLKNKERDELEEIIKFWKNNSPFDIKTLWDNRLREYYRDRYDVRENLIDWDYHMNLKPMKEKIIIHITEYNKWRQTGIAYMFGDDDDDIYECPNTTLSSFTSGTLV